MKFLEKMPLYFFYTMWKKVKNDQKLKSRGVKCFPKNTIVLNGKKVKFNLARAIELSETAVFVYNLV